MKNFFLSLSGFIYGLIAALHLVRYLQKWPVHISAYVVPQKFSLWACLIFLLLSLGCFMARGEKH